MQLLLPFLLLAGLLLQALPGTAQQANEFFSVQYSYVPQRAFRDVPGTSALNSFEVNLVTPAIKAGKRTTLNNAFYYRWSHYNFEELHSSWGKLPEQLHDIRYSLIIRHQFNQQWALLAVPRLNVRSDFRNSFDGNDLFPGLLAVAIRTSTRNPNLRWGIGVNYNNDFRRNFVVPVAAFYYTTEKMRVNIMLPGNGHVAFLPNKKLEYGVSYNIDPAIYHTGIEQVNNSAVKYIRSFNLLISPMVSCKLAGNLWANARAGYVLFRNYDLWDKDYEGMENNFKPAPFFSAGFGLRLNR